MDYESDNPAFLKEKYSGLHVSRESLSAARRTKVLSGESVSQKPNDRIDNLLERYGQFAFDSEKRNRLRSMIMNEYIYSNKEKLAEGAARVEERAARELGIDMHYGEEALDMRGDIAAVDLEKSLDQWINYFSDPNEPYAPWFRYYAFRSVLELGRWDKDKNKFPKRSPGTNLLFPDIDRGALGYVQDMISSATNMDILEKIQKGQRQMDTPTGEVLTQKKAQDFAKLSFAEQYAEGIRQKGEITPEMREETKGMWITYRQGTDPTALWKSLQNKGTSWCTAGFGTAKAQLDGGDFHVYYTLDRYGNPTIPRVAIRMQEGVIFEARGVADSQQNIEGNMGDIAEKQIDKLPGAEKYRKAKSDMRLLTEIENRVKQGQDLSRPELIFLYEINSPIEGFGYEKDPRIKELKDFRVAQGLIKTDVLIVLGTKDHPLLPSQIAWGTSDVITENTKAYIGPLFPGIFKLLPKEVEIYESFPNGRIKRPELTAQGEADLSDTNVSEWVKSDLLTQVDYPKQKVTLSLVILTPAMVGLPNGATKKEFFEKAASLGAKLCPAFVGPHLREQYKDQPDGEWLTIAMEPITDADGRPFVFRLSCGGGGLWLGSSIAFGSRRWDSGSWAVFLVSR